MGYIQKNLMAGEKIAYEAKLHSIIYTGPILLALLSFLVFLIPIENKWINAGICLVLLLVALFWAISINGGKQYVVTTNRLIFKHGIINRNSHELLLKKCEGVEVDQSIMGRIFNYGTVNHIVVPDESIFRQQGSGNRYVYVYEDGKVTFKEVFLGRHIGKAYELLNTDIQDSSYVAITGLTRLKDGLEVDVV